MRGIIILDVSSGEAFSLKSILAEKRAGLKPPAQYMEALRAGVAKSALSGLSRTEAGL